MWRTGSLSLCRRKYSLTLLMLGILICYTSFKPTNDRNPLHPYKVSHNVTYSQVKEFLRQQHDLLHEEHYHRHVVIEQSSNSGTYRQRQERVRHICQTKQSHHSSFSLSDFLSKSWVVERYKLLYCEVPKVGCTFWKRTLEVLRRHYQHLNSPYQLLYEECKRGNEAVVRNISDTVSKGRTQADTVLKHFTTFMFTREPFQRLFSAYIDKFFSPNAPYWTLARGVIFPYRVNKSYEGKLPGHDVTFSEFIKYILRTPSQDLDPHLRPVYLVCDMCNIQFNIIGKMETFQTDAFHIISSINASRNLVFRDFQLESTVDTIVDLVGKVFQYRQTVESFLDFEDILRRVWRRLKIANILDSRQPFPFTKTDIPFIQMEQFTRVIIDLYKHSLNTTRNNKKVAFLQAYRQLSDKTLSDLRDMYRPDFELFDYDITGPHLAQIQESLTSVDMEYDYFDIIR